jgi:hypothetical protein
VTKVLCFCVEASPPYPDAHWFVGLAITDGGKWIAGAVSRASERAAVERVYAMAMAKAKGMISGDCAFERLYGAAANQVRDAALLAFQNMP